MPGRRSWPALPRWRMRWPDSARTPHPERRIPRRKCCAGAWPVRRCRSRRLANCSSCSTRPGSAGTRCASRTGRPPPRRSPPSSPRWPTTRRVRDEFCAQRAGPAATGQRWCGRVGHRSGGDGRRRAGRGRRGGGGQPLAALAAHPRQHAEDRAEHRGRNAVLSAVPGGRRMGRRVGARLGPQRAPGGLRVGRDGDGRAAVQRWRPARRRPRAVGRTAVGAGGSGRASVRGPACARGRAGRAAPDSGENGEAVTADAGLGSDSGSTAPVQAVAERARAVLDEIERAVVGKRPALEMIMTAVLARAHVLIEDLPGLGKKLIARSFAAALGLDFRRVQFTPDLLPADLTGATVLDQPSGEFRFRPGPVFTNLLLADEINRTPPKTQAALLEAMAEGQVSIDGVTHKLPAPFIVLATDNPIEYEGTYPLPEAQLDRFAIRLELRYLSEDEEATMLRRRLERGSAEPTVNQVVDAHDLVAMRESVEQVTVHDDVLAYVVSLANASRQHPQVAVGASPRAELDLVQHARARALLLGRDYVIPEDVKSLAVPTMAHRISLKPEMWVRRVHGADVVEELLRRLPVPRARA